MATRGSEEAVGGPDGSGQLLGAPGCVLEVSITVIQHDPRMNVTGMVSIQRVPMSAACSRVFFIYLFVTSTPQTTE